MKKARPTLETAHRFHAEGSYEVGPYVTDEERTAFADALLDDLLNLVKAEFPRRAKLEYALLKCHLIVEHALIQFIRGSAHVVVEAKDLQRFSFAHKLHIAYLMGFGATSPLLVPAIELLNQVRNQAAHSFELDRKRVDEMLRIVSEDYEDFEMADDRERVRRLRGFATFICANLAARLSANIWFLTHLKNQERDRIASAPLGEEPGA